MILFLFLFIGLFILYPLGFLFWNFKFSFFGPEVWVPLGNSFKLGVSVGFLSVVVAFVLALATTQKNFLGRRFFSTMATLPLISPPFVLALSSILLFGRQGFLTQKIFGGKAPFEIYGFWGLVLVETLAYAPTAYLILKGVLQAIPSSMKEAALNLGANRRQTFLRVIL
ncbi:MAG: ABC transporter permease subunit, partial [Deltaproteobacteria bacterium]|nr:ABC transporter permease subunit [Deltaproteobacteria bacterium]